MLKRFFIALAVLLSIIAVILYYRLGGSKPLKFSAVTEPTIYIVGQYFEGKHNDPKVEKIFFAAKERADTTQGAALMVVNYQNDQKNKIIKQFIGSGTTIKPQNIPNHLELRIFPEHLAVVTTINAHNAVMPTAETVLEKATSFAKQKGYKIDSLSLETYFSERQLRIIFPVQEN